MKPSKVFVQEPPPLGYPHTLGGYFTSKNYFSGCAETVARSFLRVGSKVQTFSSGEVPRGLNRRTPIRGTTSEVGRLYQILFDRAFPWFDIPNEWSGVSNRKFQYMTVGELLSGGRSVLKEVCHPPYWVKPRVSKSWKPRLIREWNSSHKLFFSRKSPEEEIFVAQWKDFLAEERFFFTEHGNKILNGRRLPDRQMRGFLESLRGRWSDCPYSFSVDIGTLCPTGGPRSFSVVETNSLLCCSLVDGVGSFERPGWGYRPIPYRVLAEIYSRTWESYARYGRTGSFQ